MKSKCGFRTSSAIALICGLLISSVCAGIGSAEETVHIAAGEWSPYLSPDLPHYGIAGRIITESFAEHGIRAEFKFLPWKRAFTLTLQGEFDGTAIWFKNSEREKLFHCSDPVVKETFVFFHLKSQSFNWETIEDLKGKILGGLIGFSYGEAMDRAIESKMFKMERTPSDLQNFKKLLIGRVQIYPQEINVGYQVLNTKFLHGECVLVTHHDKPFLEQSTHLLMTRQHERNERLIKLFNSGLKSLIEQGKIEQCYDEIRQKH